MMQHLIANTSGYGPSQMEDGGRKIQYQVDLKLRCRGFQKWEDKEKQVGITVDWDVVTSALGAPGQTVKSYIRFGQGIDHIWEAVDVGCDLGLIDKAGAWFTLDFLETHDLEKVKVQGQQKVWQHLKDNEDHLNILLQDIKSMLQ